MKPRHYKLSLYLSHLTELTAVPAALRDTEQLEHLAVYGRDSMAALRQLFVPPENVGQSSPKSL